VLWDHLFGTFVEESEPAVFGITKPLPGRGPLVVSAGGYPELWRDVRAEPSGRDRLALLTARP
jgi:hypothetical protein